MQPLDPNDLAVLACRLAARCDRTDEPDPNDRPVTILVLYKPVDVTELRDCVLAPADHSLVLVGPVGAVPTGNGFVLTAADDLRGYLTPLGLDLHAVLRDDTRLAVVELIADDNVTSPPDTVEPHDDRVVPLAVIDADVDDLIAKIPQPRPIEVRVLTAAPTVDGWHTPPNGQVTTEIAVFFATRAQPITPLRARSFLYPRRHHPRSVARRPVPYSPRARQRSVGTAAVAGSVDKLGEPMSMAHPSSEAMLTEVERIARQHDGTIDLQPDDAEPAQRPA